MSTVLKFVVIIININAIIGLVKEKVLEACGLKVFIKVIIVWFRLNSKHRSVL